MIDSIKRLYQKSKLKDSSFEFLFEIYSGDEVIVLDTETTGLNPKKDAIISIGAVRVKGNRAYLGNAFEEYLKPDTKISIESIKIHGIREIDLQNAKDAKDVIPKLLHFIGNRPIVGYYIDFDKKILSRYTKDLIGIELPNQTIELSQMYYKRYKKHSAYEFVDLKFDTIIEQLDLPKLGKHDALNDAIMSAMIYLKLKTIPEYKGAFS